MTRILAGVVGALTAVVLGTGVYVTFRYRPDASGVPLALQRLHAFSSLALAVVVVVVLAGVVWARRPDRRHGLPAFAVVLAVGGLLVAEIVLGGRLAWDQIALGAVVVGRNARGVLLDGLALRFVVTDGREIDVDAFRRLVWLHVLVIPVVVAAGSGFVAWWTRRFARPEARPARPGPDDLG